MCPWPDPRRPAVSSLLPDLQEAAWVRDGRVSADPLLLPVSAPSRAGLVGRRLWFEVVAWSKGDLDTAPAPILRVSVLSGGEQRGSVLVVAPAALLHRQIPQPHGRVLYNLVTGHRDRAPHDLVFLADLIHSPHSASCSKAIPGYQLRWGPEQLERRDKPAWRKG